MDAFNYTTSNFDFARGLPNKNSLLSTDGAWLTALSLSHFVALIRARENTRLSSLLLASVATNKSWCSTKYVPQSADAMRTAQCVVAAPVLKTAHVISRRVRPHAFALRSNDLFLSEPSAGWMETATDVRLSPEKPPIPTVTPFLAGQAHYWQDTEFQWSRTFDQSTHFWGVFACFMGVCSNLLSETHVQKLQMGRTHVCSFYLSMVACQTVLH